MICVSPPRRLRGSVQIPSSKPHCQRAVILAMLAEGETCIHRMSVCSETQILIDASQTFGATFQACDHSLKVQGVAGKLQRPKRILHVEGSGFALRNILALASLVDGPTILTGSKRLGQRPLMPLVHALSRLGINIEMIEPDLPLPLVNWGEGPTGGVVLVPAAATSQFTTALMLMAPYASAPITLLLEDEIVSREYIALNIACMQKFGANVKASEDFKEIEIRPGGYTARELTIGSDVTLLFSFLAAAVVIDTDIVIDGVSLGIDPLVDEAVAIGRKLGVSVTSTPHGIRVLSGTPPQEKVDLHVSHVPTLVPALAAIACSLPHGLRVTGAEHIRFHKTSRLEAVMSELEKINSSFTRLYHNGNLDGFDADFVIKGSTKSDMVESYGDHRLFMALYIACLRSSQPVYIQGEEALTASFPEFVTRFTELGAVSDERLPTI